MIVVLVTTYHRSSGHQQYNRVLFEGCLDGPTVDLSGFFSGEDKGVGHEDRIGRALQLMGVNKTREMNHLNNFGLIALRTRPSRGVGEKSFGGLRDGRISRLKRNLLKRFLLHCTPAAFTF